MQCPNSNLTIGIPNPRASLLYASKTDWGAQCLRLHTAALGVWLRLRHKTPKTSYDDRERRMNRKILISESSRHHLAVAVSATSVQSQTILCVYASSYTVVEGGGPSRIQTPVVLPGCLGLVCSGIFLEKSCDRRPKELGPHAKRTPSTPPHLRTRFPVGRGPVGTFDLG